MCIAVLYILVEIMLQSKISIFKTVNSTFQSSTSNNLSALCYFLPAETAGVDVNYLGCLGPQSSHRGIPDLQLSSNKSPNRRAQLQWIAPAKQQPSKRGREKPHFLLCWGENLPTTCGGEEAGGERNEIRGKKATSSKQHRWKWGYALQLFFFCWLSFPLMWSASQPAKTKTKVLCCGFGMFGLARFGLKYAGNGVLRTESRFPMSSLWRICFRCRWLRLKGGRDDPVWLSGMTGYGAVTV